MLIFRLEASLSPNPFSVCLAIPPDRTSQCNSGHQSHQSSRLPAQSSSSKLLGGPPSCLLVARADCLYVHQCSKRRYHSSRYPSQTSPLGIRSSLLEADWPRSKDPGG